jgi:hypothetical protein
MHCATIKMLVQLVNVEISNLVERSQCHFASTSENNPLNSEPVDVEAECTEISNQIAISEHQASPKQSSPNAATLMI